MSDKEPIGDKRIIKLRVQYIKPIMIESYRNIPKYFHKQCDGMSKKFSHTVRVKTVDINTQDKIAGVIRYHFAFGKFNVLFWNRYQKSKRFNPRFICKHDKCKWQQQCRIESRHQKGWSCKANRRFQPNWSPRAKLKINYDPRNRQQDYVYKWYKSYDKMHYMWFWEKGRI